MGIPEQVDECGLGAATTWIGRPGIDVEYRERLEDELDERSREPRP